MKKILIILLLFTACSPQHRIARHTKRIQTIALKNNIDLFNDDTTTNVVTIVDTIYKDTTIYVQLPNDTIIDSIELVVFQHNIKDITRHFKSKYINAKVEVKNNKIYLDIKLNRKRFKVLLKDFATHILKTHQKTVTITKKVPTNYLTWWQKTFIIIGKLFCVGLVILILWMLIAVRLRK